MIVGSYSQSRRRRAVTEGASATAVACVGGDDGGGPLTTVACVGGEDDWTTLYMYICI